MEDTQIVALFFARSEEAISETSKKYGRYLKTIAGNVLPSSEDVEEILNDVYLAAWNSIPPNRPPVLKYYLSRIVRNLSFKRIEYLTAGAETPISYYRSWKTAFRTPAGICRRCWKRRSWDSW